MRNLAASLPPPGGAVEPSSRACVLPSVPWRRRGAHGKARITTRVPVRGVRSGVRVREHFLSYVQCLYTMT